MIRGHWSIFYLLREPSKVKHQRLFCIGAVPGEADPGDVEQDTAAVSGKCREADDFQICVDLWAVINDFEGLPIECCTLIRTKPFGIHIAEQAAERVIQQLFQWLLFQFCQCRVSIAEDPVYSMMLLIEDQPVLHLSDNALHRQSRRDISTVI